MSSICDYCEESNCAVVAIVGKIEGTETTISIGKCARFQGDLIAKVREEERARCAKICESRAAMLQATADKYPAGTAACFVEEARELGRKIRGEK